MEKRSLLQGKLREGRYTRASGVCLATLAGIGLAASEPQIVPLDELEALWSDYSARLKNAAVTAERWPLAAPDAAQRRLDEVAGAAGDFSVVWLALVETEPVGIRVPAGPLLRAALAYFVTRAGDLMLVTHDGEHGICVELNCHVTEDEYEVVRWGRFAA